MQRDAGEFHSRFGGFWIDRHDAGALLAERVANGRIRPEVGERIEHFMRDGYVIIPGAVSTDVTARIREEIEQIWTSPPEGALIESWTRLGRHQVVTPELRLRTRASKLLDLYLFSETARAAIAAPAVVEMLEAVFEARPKAFQSLTFWRGSEQSIHKDTAREVERVPVEQDGCLFISHHGQV